MSTQSNNLKVECTENCGNSPKKMLLKELSIAFAENKISFCMDWMTDDVVWDLIGDKQIQGKANFEKVLIQMQGRRALELHIHNIITHGNTGSVNGTLLLNDQQSVAFCDVYNFRGTVKNAKIKAITSYVIKIS
ncbi:nuclear transport factor 2 family protein [Pseudogracilibacillus auburnensis]|uniref:SnoaL-like protein n=1 Tax=Pseudogracilibacillus auburnensis TaxID=1494959 RepID=A0A2V3WPB7_9BACI|nr:nuclear transport factor 2 family protein [Pseudogracilibacillus auburnensis]PXW90559.1 hypothetical protein DFR56_101471 [Pseudogracilibacillus auburnensis]